MREDFEAGPCRIFSLETLAALIGVGSEAHTTGAIHRYPIDSDRAQPDYAIQILVIVS